MLVCLLVHIRLNSEGICLLDGHFQKQLVNSKHLDLWSFSKGQLCPPSDTCREFVGIFNWHRWEDIVSWKARDFVESVLNYTRQQSFRVLRHTRQSPKGQEHCLSWCLFEIFTCFKKNRFCFSLFSLASVHGLRVFVGVPPFRRLP